MVTSLPQHIDPVVKSAIIEDWERSMLLELLSATADRLCAEQMSEIPILASLTAMRASRLRYRRLYG